MRKATILCLAAALLMALFGIWRGEVAVVMSKGTNLCLEFVGIG